MNIRGALIGVAMAMASSTAGAGLAPFLVNLTNGTGVTPVECFSANDAGNCATANAQLELYAWNAATLAGSSSAFSGFGGLGANQVLWEFRNVGANASSSTQVYWENPGLSTLLSIGGFIDADDNFIAGNGDPGVDFSVGTPQPNVPAGNTVSIANGCQRRSKSTPLAGVKMHHLMRFSPALAVVPVVHRRDARCFV